MKKSPSKKQKQRVTLASLVAAEILGAMATTGTTFEVLAKRINMPLEELRGKVYGLDYDITIGEICLICHAMDCELKFSVAHEFKLAKTVKPKPSYLTLVK